MFWLKLLDICAGQSLKYLVLFWLNSPQSLTLLENSNKHKTHPFTISKTILVHRVYFSNTISETYPAFAFGHCKKNQFKIVSPSCNKWKTCPKRKWGPRLKQKVCLFCFGTLPEDCCQRKVTRVIINGSILFNYSIFYFLEPRAEIKEIPIRYKPPDIKALSEKTGLVKE